MTAVAENGDEWLVGRVARLWGEGSHEGRGCPILAVCARVGHVAVSVKGSGAIHFQERVATTSYFMSWVRELTGIN
jgi:hypothetical protein